MTVQLLKKFAIYNDKVFPFTQQEGAIIESIPPALYHVEGNAQIGLYLARKADKAMLPAELYGSTASRANMIMDTYNRKEEGIGIGLFGAKGAGKTLLSNVLTNMLIEQGVPVIDVSSFSSYSPELLDFINSLGECGIIFDEFFKTLKNQNQNSDVSDNQAVGKGQEQMLTFFSGTNKSKRLIILIDNYSHQLNDFFLHRPSRLRYIFNYIGVEADIVKALAAKANFSEATTDALVTYALKHSCTFDMVNELIDEIQNNKCIDAENVDLAAVCSYFNAPSVQVQTERKVRVASFVANPHSRVVRQLANNLAISNGKGRVAIATKCPIPWPSHKLTEEEFEAFEQANGANALEYDYDGYNYRWQNMADGYVTENITVGNPNLVNIKDNIYTYSDAWGTYSIIDDIEPAPEYNFDFF